RELDCLEASPNKSNGVPEISAISGTTISRVRYPTQRSVQRVIATLREHGTGLQSNESPTRLQGGSAMAKDTNFARQTTEQAMQTTDWMRAIAEQNLNQSKAAFESLLTIARNAASGVDQQAAFIRDSMLFAEETLENTFDFAHKLVRMKEPQEFARIQTEFFSRQAQVLAGSGQRILQDVNDVAKTTLEGAAESSGRRFEAA